MYIVKTPFRISFFGGGTDFETYFREFGGSVLSTTINKYCYVTVRKLPPIFDYRSQLTYSKIERFNEISEIQHPLVREALNLVNVDRIQITYDADLPANSGIGSSSSFAVGLLKGLHAMRNEFPDKMDIAKEAIYVERKLCKEAGGVQDQLAASFGGFNRFFFSDSGYRVEPVIISDKSKKALSENLMLIFTGFTRYSSDVSEMQQKNIFSRLNYLHEMERLTEEACTLLQNNRIDDFGRLLDYTWTCKKQLSDKISNEETDLIYRKALDCGALGGKIIGAGGGGFMLIYAPKEKHTAIKKELHDFQFFDFDFEDKGSIFINNNDA